MNRSLLVLAVLMMAPPAYSMTATVQSTTPSVTAPSAPVAGSAINSATKAATAPATGSSARAVAVPGAAAKSTMPNAASLTRPAAVLATPRVPPKGNAVNVAKPSAGKPRSILPASAPVPDPTPAATTAAWTAVAATSSAMHKGALEAINVGSGTFQVHGQKLNFNAQRVKVFARDGKPASVFGLKSGANVRFTLDPADPRRRRVAVIYII